jgi:hypothetical protein
MRNLPEIEHLISNIGETIFPGQGLYDGTAGKAMLLAATLKNTNNIAFDLPFQKSVEELSENIATVTDTNFRQGFAGIGWAIEWLTQNKLLRDINTDEVLEDFDDLIYKAILHTRPANLTLLDGEAGWVNYFIFRNRSKNAGTSRFRKMVNRECLTILEDRISNYLSGITDTRFLIKDNAKTIIALGDILKVLSPSYSVLDTDKESILKKSLVISESVLSEFTEHQKMLADVTPVQHIDLLYLSANLLFSAINIRNKVYQARARKFVYMLLTCIDKNRSDLTQEALLKLTRVRILIYLYDKNERVLNELEKDLGSLKTTIHRNSSINELTAYVLGWQLLEYEKVSFNMQEILFYS